MVYLLGILAFPQMVFAANFDPFSIQALVPASPAKEMVEPIGSGETQDPCNFATLGSPLDLLETVERALCHNPKTRQAWANVKVQAALVGVNKAEYLPKINATLGVTKANSNTSVSGFPALDAETNTTTRSGNLTLNWTLFDFGLRRANLDNSRHLLTAAYATQDATLQAVFLTTAQAYYNVLAAQGSLSAANEAEKSARESFMAAEAMYKAGAGALADKLQAQTNHAQTRLGRVKAEGELKSAQGSLAIVMGLDVNRHITLNSDSMSLPDTGLAESVDDFIEEAKRNHPSLMAAQAQLLAAQAKVDAVRAAGLPSLALTGGVNVDDRSGQDPGDAYTRNDSIGIQLSIPLFEGFGRIYRVQLAKAEVESKAIDVISLEQQIALDVWKSYQSLRTEAENLNATNELLLSASQSFNVAQGRYKAGIGNILELLTAQSSHAGAQQFRIQSLVAWHTARLALLGNLGKLGLWAIQ